MAPKKTKWIQHICRTLYEERGQTSLEYLRNESKEGVHEQLERFTGVGKKTVAIINLFDVGHPDMAVDTHVFRYAEQLGWVPSAKERAAHNAKAKFAKERRRGLRSCVCGCVCMGVCACGCPVLRCPLSAPRILPPSRRLSCGVRLRESLCLEFFLGLPDTLSPLLSLLPTRPARTPWAHGAVRRRRSSSEVLPGLPARPMGRGGLEHVWALALRRKPLRIIADDKDHSSSGRQALAMADAPACDEK